MVLAEQFSARSFSGSATIPGLNSALVQLQEQVRGSVLVPQDERYAAACPVHNGAFSAQPAMIVQVESASDVVAALRFARQHALEIAIRGGGHSPAGFGSVEAGMVIDMGRMKQVQVDVTRRLARVEPGLRNGELLAALAPFGFVVPVGDASTTGVVGMVTGGGYGYLSGKHGLALDNLLAVELVTAEGDLLRVSEQPDEHPDLFWAIRGGGSNFGIVTVLEFRVHPLTEVLSGMLIYPFERAAEVLRTYRAVTATATDELTTYAIIATPPDQGPIVVVLPCWSGDLAAGEQAIAPFRALGPIVDTVAAVPYSVPSSSADPFAPAGMPRIEQWMNVSALTDEVLDGLATLAAPSCARGGTVVIKQLNGAASRVAPEATAFAHRQAPYSVLGVAMFFNAEQQQYSAMWTEAVTDLLAEVRMGNYGNGSLSATSEQVYGVNLPRLRRVKQQYDPQNVFHTNYNIAPTASSTGE